MDAQPQPSNQHLQFDEKGLLQPETNRHIVYALPTDLTPEERSAYLTISRVNEQIEQPIHRAKRSSPAARPKTARKMRASTKAKRASRKASNHSKRSKRRDEEVELTPHEARCSICHHEYRDAIEEEFLHWHSPANIAYDFDVAERAIYRHAHAVKLFGRRDRNLRYALGRMIDRVDRIPVMTPESIIRAIQAFARINDQGQWVEPPKHLIISQGPRMENPIEASGNVVTVPAAPPDATFVSKNVAPPFVESTPLPPPRVETRLPHPAPPKEAQVLIHRTDGPPLFIEQSKLDAYRNSLR